MPNPSEMHRLEVEARNEEFKKMVQSRNTVCDTAADVTRLVTLKIKIKTEYLSKYSKQAILSEIRSLEKRLGIDGTSYNSEAF